MADKQQFIVIGLGVFGATIATELARLGHDVLGIDTNEQRVDHLADVITHAVIADVTDPCLVASIPWVDKPPDNWPVVYLSKAKPGIPQPH